MAVTLDNLRDNDKLVSLEHVHTNSVSPREMYLKATGQRVFVSPQAHAVSDFIVGRPDLVTLSRLMLIDAPPGGFKGAPIFGVLFERSLEAAARAVPGFIQKSMFKVLNPQATPDYARCATLVAHVQKTADYIQLEAWQRVEPHPETLYLQGLLRHDCSCFYHLDGATMHHSDDEASRLFVEGVKQRGTGYQKWFRLDGEIKTEDAVALAKAHFLCDELVREYLERYEEGAVRD